MYRAYAPGHARWLNRDPIWEAAGVNLYAYQKAWADEGQNPEVKRPRLRGVSPH